MRQLVRILSLATVVPAVLALSSCTDDTQGVASPSTDEDPGATHTELPNTPTSTPPATEVDPCSLLSKSELTPVGTYSDPQKEVAAEGTAGESHVCGFNPERSSTESLPTIGVILRTKSGIEDVVDNGGGVHDSTFNGRPVALAPDPDASCLLALELTTKSRVDVAVTGIDTEEACQLVGQVTEIVEPKLPGGN